jgi:NAD+--dinitrogen-reductase ADP-D-ribosyltransferase
LLKGWGFDSNSMEGAVLKGWVESRFGLFPIYHKEPIVRFNSKAWVRYVEEKMASRFHNNAIYTQLDLLYTFCQWMLERFGPGNLGHFTLYRGVHGFGEDTVVERVHKRRAMVRLNSLTSFTTMEDVAQTFGDIVFKTSVPAVKVVFDNDLFPENPLRGEHEYMALGGTYNIEILP